MRPRIPYADLFGDQLPKVVSVMVDISPSIARKWAAVGVPWYWGERIGSRRLKEIRNAKQAKRDAPMTWREYAMACDYKAGKTLEEIGQSAGLTRERVRQILAKNGITRADGGAKKKADNRTLLIAVSMREKFDAKKAKMEALFRCSYDELLTINGGEFSYRKSARYSTAAGKYVTQMRSAEYRGIGWEITFPEWWRVWQESGKWEQRGRGQGYCMARIGDTGPYSVDNVEIKTIGENFSESYFKHPWKERFRVGKPFCIRGHALTKESKSPSGNCRECQRIRAAAYRARKANKGV